MTKVVFHHQYLLLLPYSKGVKSFTSLGHIKLIA